MDGTNPSVASSQRKLESTLLHWIEGSLLGSAVELCSAPSFTAIFGYINPQDFNSNKKNTIVATSIYSGVILFVIFIINTFQFGMDQLHGKAQVWGIDNSLQSK